MDHKNRKITSTSIVKALCEFIPVAQDPPREWVRKIAFLMAFIVFIGAGWYLLDDMWMQPQQTQGVINNLRDWYYSEDGGNTVLPDQNGEPVQFPVGMLPQYQALYRGNPEVRGWIRFVAGEGEEDLFEGCIDNPIVQTSDNDYYLDHDFWGRQDKAGTLYFDYRNDLSDIGVNRNLIVYGHNLKSGLMFSKFNRLVSGKVDRAQKLSTLSLSTLYEERTYRVFAVLILDAQEEGTTGAFSALRTQFGSENDFLRYVQQIRDRSLYTFSDVDVTERDELLTMLTCSNKKDTTLKEGRTVIVARRVREGEDVSFDPTTVTLNENVLMPRQWYLNKNLPLPDAYVTQEVTRTTVMSGLSSSTESTTQTTASDATTSDTSTSSTSTSDTIVTTDSTTTSEVTTVTSTELPTTTTAATTTMTTTVTTTTTTMATTTVVTTATTVTTTTVAEPSETMASIVNTAATTTTTAATVASVVAP